MRKIAFSIMNLATVGMVLSACGRRQTSDQTTVTSVYNTTVGEELTNLQDAYESGAISEREYQQTREAILRRHNDS